MRPSRAHTRVMAVVAGLAALGLLGVVWLVARERLQGLAAGSRLRTACVRGDAASCVRLGWEYEQGVRRPADPARALSLYERACELGAAQGCFFAGTLRENAGDGGRPRVFYQRACEGGQQDGCTAQRRLGRGGAAAAQPAPAIPRISPRL